VQIVDCGTGAVSDVVAGMQADDLVVVCSSLSEAQAVAETIYAYSKKWRFKLNSKKSAVMHVPLQGRRSVVRESDIVWDGVPVPIASKYCYLGLWFQNDLSWDVHFEHVLQKVQKVTKCFMPLWKNRHINVEIKRIVLLSCVRPVIEYGSEVWLPTASQQQKIDAWQMHIIKLSMHSLSYNPCNEALLAEWGVKPMHLWLHERVLMFYAKLRLMPDNRLPKKVFGAVWYNNGRAACLPWQKHVDRLLCKYGVVLDDSASNLDKCKSIVKRCVKSVWHDELTLIKPMQKVTLKRYIDWVSPSLLRKLSWKSCCPYLGCLTPSYGVELLMRVRLSCLPVHAHTAGFRQSDEDLQLRRRSQVQAVSTTCPVCCNADESVSHFLFDCHGLQNLRSTMYDGIRAIPDCGNKLNGCLAIADSQKRVYRFVSDDYWGSEEKLECVLPCITQYLTDAWKIRNQCKYGGGRTTIVDVSASAMGRGADGRDAMADG
jgi:hypothetical protein